MLLGLRPIHFDQCLANWHHFLSTYVDTCQLSFSGGGHDTFYYLGNGENRSIVVGDGDVFRQHDMSTCLTPSFSDFDICCIGVGGQNHVAGAEGYAISRICSYTFQELGDGVVGFFDGRGILFA